MSTPNLTTRSQAQTEYIARLKAREQVLIEHLEIFDEALREKRDRLRVLRSRIKMQGGKSQIRIVWEIVRDNPGITVNRLTATIKEEQGVILTDTLRAMLDWNYVVKINENQFVIGEEEPSLNKNSEQKFRGTTDKIVKFFVEQENKPVTYAELCKLLDVSIRAITGSLGGLRRQGKLKAHKPRNKIYNEYYLTDAFYNEAKVKTGE